MMSYHGGKPCKNCKIVLIPPKWEEWLLFPFFVLAILVPEFASFSRLQTVVFILFFLIAVIYLTAAFIPLKVKSQAT